jgi:hypothetical protein
VSVAFAEEQFKWDDNDHCRIMCEKPVYKAGGDALLMFLWEARDKPNPRHEKITTYEQIIERCSDLEDWEGCFRYYLRYFPETRDILILAYKHYNECAPKYCNN